MRTSTHILIAVLAAASAWATAEAHEFWLMPESFRVEVGAPVRVTLNHGERFAGEVVPRNERLISLFTLAGPSGRSDVAGLSGRAFSFTRCTEPGAHAVVYHATGMTNDLDAAAFHAYLEEEGLGDIIEQRHKLGEADLPGHETYDRCSKSLISAGAAEMRDYNAGLPLEIMLDTASTASEGSTHGHIQAHVLSHGEPIEDLRVVAVSQDNPDLLLEARTDAQGMIELPCDHSGVWMLTTLHMTRSEDTTGPRWHSYWASLTFMLDE